MRILHTVEFYSPSVGGAQEIVRQVSERLAARGHEVTVATTRLATRTGSQIAGVSIEEFSITGSSVRGITGEAERYQRYLREGEFDVMLNYAAQQWATDLALPILRELPYARVIAPCGFSGLYIPQYAEYFARLPSQLAEYHGFAVNSEIYRDAEFLRAHGLEPVTILPNGAGGDEFDRPQPGGFRGRHGIAPDEPLLLAVGTHTGSKGHGLAIKAFQRARLPRSTLVVVGNDLPASDGCIQDCRRAARRTSRLSLGRRRVLLLDATRAETLEAFAAADVFVHCSEIECSPLVLIEAAASGTPFIATQAGNSAEIAELTGAGLVVSGRVDGGGYLHGSRAEVSAAITMLMRDSAQRLARGEAGRAAWAAGYRWEDIVLRYEALYLESIARHRAERSSRPATGA